MLKIILPRTLALLFIIFTCTIAKAQSYNEDKTAFTNYIKRMYKVAPFEGGKIIEDADNKYFIAAISISNENPNSITLATEKAFESAKSTFAEPCVKFEMLESISNESQKSTTYLFTCVPLKEFVLQIYKKASFSGTRIIATPKSKYLISVVSVNAKSNSSSSLNDRLAGIKAKQQTSALFNGSNISSDIVIYTDDKTGKTISTEIIREQTMGFAEGLELLDKFQDGEQSVYFFYREMSTK